uniref:HMA domain-containing protein n=1 Tax=Aegilops tauschii subsp. strangulata TaxID=200361 RepID=A0A453ANG2_AEGTS
VIYFLESPIYIYIPSSFCGNSAIKRSLEVASAPAMAEKVSTLIIEANLECEKCYKKIQKVLCKLQEKEKIRTINFDTKKNMVTVSGPFDPVKLSKKLRCKACKAIKDIKIVEEKKPDAKKPEEKKP